MNTNPEFRLSPEKRAELLTHLVAGLLDQHYHPECKHQDIEEMIETAAYLLVLIERKAAQQHITDQPDLHHPKHHEHRTN